MKWKKQLICILSGGAMVLFMLDSKTALQSGIEGVQLCLQTVIPSLFPFFLMSLLLTDNLPTPRRTAPSRLERFLRLPAGSGMLVITGILGGYPVGAKVVGQSHCAGRLTKAQAQRMAVLCNAPGPAFLFGMVGSILGNLGAVWILWCHILLSAILCALIIPAQTGSRCALPDRAPVSIQAALGKAIPMMASVCSWIVLFRILTGYLQKWMPDTVAPSLRSLLFGLLELSNGIVSLRAISDPGVSFLLCSFLLPMGGVCVWMQTASVFRELSMKLYLLAKLFQSSVCFLLSSGMLMMLSKTHAYPLPKWIPILAMASAAGSALYLRNPVKISRFSKVIGV